MVRVARRGPRYFFGRNSTSKAVATGYSMPTATPIRKRRTNSAAAESTPYCAREARTNRLGPTKNSLRRPRRSVSQPPRKPPKKMPTSAEAAIMPCQKLLSCNAAVICSIATPMMLST